MLQNNKVKKLAKNLQNLQNVVFYQGGGVQYLCDLFTYIQKRGNEWKLGSFPLFFEIKEKLL